MDIEHKKRALLQFAKTEGEIAQRTLDQEASKIAKQLAEASRYDILEEQIELLNTIAHRVPTKAIEIIRSFLQRLEELEITYQEIFGFSNEKLKQFQNKYSLTKKIIQVVENLRYQEMRPCLEILLEYSVISDPDAENVKKQALEGLKKLAGYDLNLFYRTERFHGLGTWPQREVIRIIEEFTSVNKKKYFLSLVSICKAMLASEMEGTDWNYKSVILKRGIIPASDEIIKLRRKIISYLEQLYQYADSVSQKRAVLDALFEAARLPIGDCQDPVREMIIQDALVALKFIQRIIPNETLEVLQKIEHRTYYLFRRSADSNIYSEGLLVKSILDANTEYQIFKVLIGFESIFGDWTLKDDSTDSQNEIRDHIDYEERYRHERLNKFVNEFSPRTYNAWKTRILTYASIESNDGATFPYFGKFLMELGKAHPELILNLISENAESLQKFLVSPLCGVWETEKKSRAEELVIRWVTEGKYLYQAARLFEFNNDFNEQILKLILQKSLDAKSEIALIQLIGTSATKYSINPQVVSKELIIPAIQGLTELGSSNWVFDFWYRKTSRAILSNLDGNEDDIIITNMLKMARIDYHAEEILVPIAERNPKIVIDFFGKRLKSKKEDDLGFSYDAIPYEFHKLSEPLSRHPSLAIQIVRDWYDNFGLFVLRGGRFLKNIFPKFPPVFESELLKLIYANNRSNFLFVMAVLRNYEDETRLHGICKELIKILPIGDDLLIEIQVILEGTGVTVGEYGLAEAYERKIGEIRHWLNDEDEKVQDFAQKYISGLERQIELERKRADEDIELRKFKYGDEEN